MTDSVTTNGTQVTSGWPADLNGEYEFLGELGRGGMAVVYRARERALGREVAVKVVRPRFLSDEESVARLAREARTVAQLEHPNIVSLHSIKRLESGLALVMQIVPGRTLKAALAGGPLDIERAEQILRDITRALAYAHRCGVVHRDVKPENIFLDDITGRALLSDFGVARSISENSELTATGTAIGTPTYMSPEQIDGGSLDGRSDLYALGMVAWEMLTGQRPWMGESLYSVIYRQKHDSLPPLDAVRSDVPPRLQYLVEGLMHKRADDRWPGAARFLTMLASSDKLPGFKDWQASARKRRKAGYRPSSAPVEFQSISPASSTVQFRRGDTPAGTVPSSENELSIHPYISGAGLRVSDSPWGQPAVVTSGPASRGRRSAFITAATAGVAVAAVALVAFLSRAERLSAVNVVSPSLSDRAGVEVPVLPPGAPALITSAGTVDAPLPPPSAVATPESARSVVSPAPGGDTASKSLATGNPNRGQPSPGALPVPPAVVARPESASALPAETANIVRFPADRGLIAAGLTHSCALDGNGRAACWGNNDDGQLGDGGAITRLTAGAVAGEFVFSGVSAGQTHTCAVTVDGDALCWGANRSGQLGDGTTTSRTAPVRVSGSGDYRFVRSGQSHTCALTRGGNVRCWGSSARGQLGDGSRGSRNVPVGVSLGAPAGALTVGSQHSCAITTAGDALCWGRNDFGQLGDGTRDDQASPRPVQSDRKFVSISAGSSHTCAATEDGEVYCWGRNQYGQLGSGSTIDASTPNRVDGATGVATVTLGLSHSCGRTREGRGWCWGRNSSGQLGDGTVEDRLRPAAVRISGSFTALSASGSHTCGMSGGESFCWGHNLYGQLGAGDRENASAPSRVAPIPR